MISIKGIRRWHDQLGTPSRKWFFPGGNENETHYTSPIFLIKANFEKV
jgi:hypothetical protein